MRGSAPGLVYLLLCILLGTTAIALIGLLSAAVLEGMRNNARASIGGDVSLRLFHQPPSSKHQSAFQKAGAFDLVAELRARATHRSRSTLVELKVVGDTYPLFGQLLLDPPSTKLNALGSQNGMWGAAVSASLLATLKARIGDAITIGDRIFKIRALITEEPDRSLRAINLGPRVIVYREALDRSSLITPGAPVYWYSRIRLKEGIVAERWITNFERAEPHAGYRIVNAQNGVPGAERTLALVTTLLNFFASGVLLLGCIGISHSVTVWLERKLPNIAIFKSVGAMTPLIMRIYLIQIMGAAAIGVATGLTLGVYLFTNCIQFLGSWIPVRDVFPLKPLLLAGGFVFSAAILFSLLPLANAEVSKPNSLFLNVAKSPFRRLRPQRWVAFVILLITSATLGILTTPLPRLTILFVLAVICAVALFVFLGRLTAFTAKVVGRLSVVRGRPLIRFGLANLHRPGAPTTTLILVMGICLVLVISIVNLHRNAERYLSVSLPNSAPAIVLLNIDPVAGPRFDSYLQARSQVTRWMRAPFLQAKITTLNGRAVADLRIPAEAAFIIRGDRGISWQQHQPTTNLTAGKWWPADYVGPPLASLDAWAAGRLGIGIGDTLTLSIEGKPFKARVANLRNIARTALDLDFPILLSPFSKPPPHKEIGAIWTRPKAGPDIVEKLRRDLSRTFPDTPAILVADIIAFLTRITDKVGTLFNWVALIVGISAIFVSAGVVTGTRRYRLKEAVLLRTLGASRGQILTATVIELTVTSVIAGLAALIIGNIGIWAAAGELINFQPIFITALPWICALVTMPPAVGLIITFWVLRRPSGPTLRHL